MQAHVQSSASLNRLHGNASSHSSSGWQTGPYLVVLCTDRAPSPQISGACPTALHSRLKANSSCCPLRPRTTPFPEEKSILGVIYGVLLWADMNAATPLGAWGRSVICLVDCTLHCTLHWRKRCTLLPCTLFCQFIRTIMFFITNNV